MDRVLFMHVVVVILNWRGWRDTIECLESIQQLDYSNFTVVVIDNGSGDESLEKLASWARGELSVESKYVQPCPEKKPAQVLYLSCEEAEQGLPSEDAVPFLELPSHSRLVIIKSEENLGFAAANNVGIRFAMNLRVPYILLLNNDTVVDRHTLSHLVTTLQSQPDVACATGQIRYYDRPEIWNCGGNLTWFGSRKYHYHGVDVSKVPQSGTLPITFITGCALFARREVFEKFGLLTERFFFGEEDYEFSRRILKHQQKMLCCLDALVYHKVGSSVKRTSSQQANLWYINYLSRFIDMRSYMPAFLWRVWRQASLLYILPMLKVRYGASLATLLTLRRLLLQDSSALDCVSKETFERVMRFGFDRYHRSQ